MKDLVTGAAGFVGFHVSKALLARGDLVFGVDNLNDYYDVGLKEARLEQLRQEKGFQFHKLDIGEWPALARLFQEHRPESVVHLAAQAGIRYSLRAPHSYVNSNLLGFVNILEGCRHGEIRPRQGP